MMKFHIGSMDPLEWSYDGMSNPNHLNCALGQHASIESAAASSGLPFDPPIANGNW
jgi:hypothetical protein